MKNNLIVAAGLAVALGFAVFVIFLVTEPTPSSEVRPMPAPAPKVRVQVEPSTDAFMNIRGSAVEPYGLYTDELTIQPGECSATMQGVTLLKVGDICTVSIDRGMYPYIYGRGEATSFDTTSPDNSEALFVVQLRGSEPFSIFLLEEGFAENAEQLPSSVISLGFNDVFGFDIAPGTITWGLDNPLADPN